MSVWLADKCDEGHWAGEASADLSSHEVFPCRDIWWGSSPRTISGAGDPPFEALSRNMGCVFATSEMENMPPAPPVLRALLEPQPCWKEQMHSLTEWSSPKQCLTRRPQLGRVCAPQPQGCARFNDKFALIYWNSGSFRMARHKALSLWFWAGFSPCQTRPSLALCSCKMCPALTAQRMLLKHRVCDKWHQAPKAAAPRVCVFK